MSVKPNGKTYVKTILCWPTYNKKKKCGFLWNCTRYEHAKIGESAKCIFNNVLALTCKSLWILPISTIWSKVELKQYNVEFRFQFHRLAVYATKHVKLLIKVTFSSLAESEPSYRLTLEQVHVTVKQNEWEIYSFYHTIYP